MSPLIAENATLKTIKNSVAVVECLTNITNIYAIEKNMFQWRNWNYTEYIPVVPHYLIGSYV